MKSFLGNFLQNRQDSLSLRPAMLTAIEKISVQDIFRSDSNVPRRGLMLLLFCVFVFFNAFLPSAILQKLQFLIRNVTQ